VAEVSETKKWAKKLGEKCTLDPKFLESALEELTESCHGDATSSRKVIEELVMSCRMDDKEMQKFIGEVSRNCPLNSKKLVTEVKMASGDKELAFQAIDKAKTMVV
jgi:hypothetical protein